MIVAFTGHRPPKIGGYGPSVLKNSIHEALADTLMTLEPDKAISGMALGVDQIAASLCIDLSIPFIAAVPCRNQESKWHPVDQSLYRLMLLEAEEVVLVSDCDYNSKVMQIRNCWMVDNCDLLIAVYNGDKEGGTFNCVNYAKKMGKEIFIIDPYTLKSE